MSANDSIHWSYRLSSVVHGVNTGNFTLTETAAYKRSCSGNQLDVILTIGKYETKLECDKDLLTSIEMTNENPIDGEDDPMHSHETQVAETFHRLYLMFVLL
jgi:hypothetical protein